VYDPRANFNFHEHGARVLSLDGPRTRWDEGRRERSEEGEGEAAQGGKSSHELWGRRRRGRGRGRPRCY